MSPVSSNYGTPVQVNGYSCKNCTDVGYAEKHIDPAHPQSGPYNVNAESDPSRWSEAVTLGGRLTAMDRDPSQAPKAIGGLIDVSA
ncbi:MAG: hypothetical protein ABL871_12025 [Terricaulis sp.]